MRFEMEPGPQVFRMHSEYGVAKVFQTGVPEDEPYRIVLISIRRRLYKTNQVMDKLYMGEITMAEANDDPDVYNSKQELLAPLSVMYNSLVQARGLHTPSALPPSIIPAALRPNRFPLPSSPPPLAAHVYPLPSSPPPFLTPSLPMFIFFRVPSHSTRNINPNPLLRRQVGDGILAQGTLLDVIRRVNTFGIALTRLDCRQESDRHSEVLDELTTYLGLGSYLSWEEEKRCEWIEGELASKRPLLPPELPASDKVQEVLDTFKVTTPLCSCPSPSRTPSLPFPSTHLLPSISIPSQPFPSPSFAPSLRLSCHPSSFYVPLPSFPLPC